MPKLDLRRFALFALLAGGALLGARGCGGVTDDRIEARDRTTKATCDQFQACGLIGIEMGDSYVSYDSCEVTWRSNWESAWPAPECQGHIDQTQLSQCLSAIAATDCNPVDFVLTLAKCPKAEICSGGKPADGGQ